MLPTQFHRQPRYTQQPIAFLPHPSLNSGFRKRFQQSNSKSDPIPIVGGTQTIYTYHSDSSEVTIIFKNDLVKEKHGSFNQ
jgi:hypothetical protein